MSRTKVITVTTFQENKKDNLQGGPYDSPSDWTPISYQPVADRKGGESSICAEQTGHVVSGM